MANIMILGSGGREHALAWWFDRYKHKVFSAPGNAGTSSIGTNIPIDINDFNAIANSALQHNVNLVVVGPEDSLANGIGDFWEQIGLAKRSVYIFAPSKEAATLEGSKIMARKFAKKHNIPIPEFECFESEHHEANAREAKSYLEQIAKQGKEPLLVVKADGLCNGKGVFVNENIEEAHRAIGCMAQFGEAGRKFLLEEKLVGEEASVTIITDGSSYKMFHHSQDHKRRFDGDTGPNTGGMGAYAPTRLITPDMESRIRREIIEPTILGAKKENICYKGVIYFAVMVQENKPYLLEYNCRFGDPETQVIIPLTDADPHKLMMDCINGKLKDNDFRIKNEYAACVILVDMKYPQGKSTNELITIDPRANLMQDAILFHAGTKCCDNKLLTNGGRVIGATGISTIDHATAINNAYESARFINFKEKSYRKDIGYRVLKEDAKG